MENCVFCQIIAHKFPADILYEDELMTVLRDAHPLAAIHLLVLPRRHIDSLNQITEEDEFLLSKLLMKAREMAFKQGLGEKGYRLVINTGPGGGQTIFHLHIHLLGGSPMGAELMMRGLK